MNAHSQSTTEAQTATEAANVSEGDTVHVRYESKYGADGNEQTLSGKVITATFHMRPQTDDDFLSVRYDISTTDGDRPDKRVSIDCSPGGSPMVTVKTSQKAGDVRDGHGGLTTRTSTFRTISEPGATFLTEDEEAGEEDDDDDSGSRDAFSTCLDCDAETDDTFCEACDPLTVAGDDEEDDEEAGEEDGEEAGAADVLFGEAEEAGETNWKDTEDGHDADSRLLGDADDPAAAYAEGEDFEAYHVRSTADGIREHGLDQQRRKSAEQHYDGLVTAALRFLSDEEVGR